MNFKILLSPNSLRRCHLRCCTPSMLLNPLKFVCCSSCYLFWNLIGLNTNVTYVDSLVYTVVLGSENFNICIIHETVISMLATSLIPKTHEIFFQSSCAKVWSEKKIHGQSKKEKIYINYELPNLS